MDELQFLLEPPIVADLQDREITARWIDRRANDTTIIFITD